MGSLMPGWSSTVLRDDKKVRLMRNRSLTKEEVDAFWRQRGRPELLDSNGGQQQGSPLPSPRRVSELLQENAFETSRSLPASPRGGQNISPRSEPSSPAAAKLAAEGFPESSAAASDRPSMSCDWWTMSSWAFLNEPPHEEAGSSSSTLGRGRAHKAYAYDQFTVTRIVTGNA